MLTGSAHSARSRRQRVRDRNPLYVKLSDGGVRNGYTVKLLNKLYGPRAFGLGLDGLPGAKLSVVGHESESQPGRDRSA